MPVLVLGAGSTRGGDRAPGAGAGRRCWVLAVRLVFLIFSNENELAARRVPVLGAGAGCWCWLCVL